MKSRKVARYKSLAGYRYHRKNPYTRGYNVLFEAKEAYLDTAGGKWATVCMKHGTICNHKTLKMARAHLPYAEWCEECMAIAEKRKRSRR